MILVLVMLALLLGMALGALFNGVSAGRQQQALRVRALAAEAVAIAANARADHALADNQRLAQWCGRFRDMYLHAVAQMDPNFADQLRAKYAEADAPMAVASLLERCRRG